MKKVFIFLGLFLAAPYLRAADNIVTTIGPTYVTAQSSAFPSGYVSIAAPGALQRNCLTEFTITNSSNTQLSFLSGSTTNYAVNLTTTDPQGLATQLVNVQPYRLTWPKDDPFCADYNQPFAITIFTQYGAAGVPYKMNYRGYVRTSR